MENTEAAQSARSVQTVASTPRSIEYRLIRSVGLIAMAYLAICITLVCLETRLVFPGAFMGRAEASDLQRFNPANPTIGKTATLAYRAEDGSELCGRLHVRPNAGRVILFLHGNGIRASDLDDWTMQLSEAGNATVLTAEYRGFQGDDFTPTESTTIADAAAALQALAAVSNVGPSEITVYGRSLGGGIAAGLVEIMQQRGVPLQSLVLDRTFDSVMNVAADRFPWLPIEQLIRNRFDSTKRLENFSGNLVQVHGTPDQIVPMKNGRQLFATVSTPNRTWIEVSGLLHNDRMSQETLGDVIEALESLELTRTVLATDP